MWYIIAIEIYLLYNPKETAMKKLLLIAVALLALSTPSFSAVTTSDGAITIDLYEDTQSGIENMWVLDLTFNPIPKLVGEGIETFSFDFTTDNQTIYYDNQYNVLDTDYYNISSSIISVPEGMIGYAPFLKIYTGENDLVTLGGTTYLFSALPRQEGELIIGNYNLSLSWKRGNSPSYETQTIQLTGPVGFAPVPEPLSMALFAFGAFFLKFITKRK